mmetsp:Transcript_4000/g.9213  ORF Transcript_4000/g.9213 Transcript_4000/m.9213 type:complete len:106 (+) Transcript_4000:3368-3685(+)
MAVLLDASGCWSGPGGPEHCSSSSEAQAKRQRWRWFQKEGRVETLSPPSRSFFGLIYLETTTADYGLSSDWWHGETLGVMFFCDLGFTPVPVGINVDDIISFGSW